MKVGDRVLFFTIFNDKPMWLVGIVKHVMQGVEHYTIKVRKDYRGLINGQDQAVVPRQFVFENIEAADAWVKEIDQNLTRFTSSYDGSDQVWEELTKSLTWQPVEATDAQSSVSVGSLPA